MLFLNINLIEILSGSCSPLPIPLATSKKQNLYHINFHQFHLNIRIFFSDQSAASEVQVLTVLTKSEIVLRIKPYEQRTIILIKSVCFIHRLGILYLNMSIFCNILLHTKISELTCSTYPSRLCTLDIIKL